VSEKNVPSITSWSNRSVFILVSLAMSGHQVMEVQYPLDMVKRGFLTLSLTPWWSKEIAELLSRLLTSREVLIWKNSKIKES